MHPPGWLREAAPVFKSDPSSAGRRASFDSRRLSCRAGCWTATRPASVNCDGGDVLGRPARPVDAASRRLRVIFTDGRWPAGFVRRGRIPRCPPALRHAKEAVGRCSRHWRQPATAVCALRSSTAGAPAPGTACDCGTGRTSSGGRHHDARRCADSTPRIAGRPAPPSGGTTVRDACCRAETDSGNLTRTSRSPDGPLQPCIAPAEGTPERRVRQIKADRRNRFRRAGSCAAG